jgi:hypothetical protein
VTPDEREKILNVISTADGGCSGCVADLLRALSLALPNEPWKESYGDVNYETIRRRNRPVLRLMWPDSGAYDDEEPCARDNGTRSQS